MNTMKSLTIEQTSFRKSPLPPLFQRGGFYLPLEKGGGEGFYQIGLRSGNQREDR